MGILTESENCNKILNISKRGHSDDIVTKLISTKINQKNVSTKADN